MRAVRQPGGGAGMAPQAWRRGRGAQADAATVVARGPAERLTGAVPAATFSRRLAGEAYR